jgi:hypothetical protein
VHVNSVRRRLKCASVSFDQILLAAAHRAYERKLANAQEVVMSIGGAIHLALRAFIVGSLLGAATMGISGPLGAVAGGATGAAQGVIVDVRDVLRQRRARGWISVHHQLDRLCSPSIALH